VKMTEDKAKLSNGNTKTDISKPSGAGPSKHNAIISQVEYYFGDINLPRDKFLQEEMKKEDGWVPLDTMIKFNRLARITTDLVEIAKALQKSDLVEVSDDGTKVRRNPEIPLPEDTLEYWHEIKRRTVYLKGFAQDATLDEIMDIVKQFGEVKNIVMRRTKSENNEPKVFKGSILVTFVDVETAKKMASIEGLKYKDIDLVNKMQEKYIVDKKSEIKKKRDAAKVVKNVQKKQIIQEQTRAQAIPERVNGCVLKVTGFPANIHFDKVKEFIKKYGNAIFVISEKSMGGKSEAEGTFYIRFKEENSAVNAWEKAVAEGTDGKVLFEDKELKGHVLEGEEEDKYWTHYSKQCLAKNEMANDVRNQRKKQKDGGRNKQSRRNQQKRPAQDDDTSEQKKAKRIVFEDAANEDADDEPAENEAATVEEVAKE